MVSLTGTDGNHALIRARGLDRTYRRGGEEIHVLRGLDLDVSAGEFVAFMGPSGSGKTTLLNLLGGLDTPTAGTVSVGGTDLATLSRRQLAAWRARHVGFVFQIYNLVPVLTAFRNVELPLLLTSLSRAERRTRVETALRIVGLEDRTKHYPRQLSGGQEQRVAIARAIVASPGVLLCDEPTGDLDRASADAVLDLLSTLVAEHSTDRAHGDARSTRRRAREHDRRARERRARRPHGVDATRGAAAVKFLPMLSANLRRKKIRTMLTIGSFIVAFFLFGLLGAIRYGFRQGIDVAGADRLVVIGRTSIIQPLPLPYFERLKRVPGVKDVAHATWFGGVYQDPKNFFAQFAIVPDDWRRMYPEFVVDPRASGRRSSTIARAASSAGSSRSASAGRSATTSRSRRPAIWAPAGWDFNVRAIYHGTRPNDDETQFWLRHDYLIREGPVVLEGHRRLVHRARRESRCRRRPSRRPSTRSLANSASETRTQTESAFAAAFVNQMGNIEFLIRAIGAARLLHAAAGDGQHHGDCRARAHERAGRRSRRSASPSGSCSGWCWPSRC